MLLLLEKLNLPILFRGNVSFCLFEELNSSFFSYIDQMSLVMRTKNATEILDDATLVTYNSFDGGSYVDSGPLRLTVTTNNITSVSGRVNQAIRLNSNSSYYQVKKKFEFFLMKMSLHRWVVLFFLVFLIILIQYPYGLILQLSMDQQLFIFRQQKLVKVGVLI